MAAVTVRVRRPCCPQVSQIVASSSDAYYLGQGLNKRELALVFGGLMQLSVLLPSLRHFRIINIIGLLSTTYTAW
jgi:hypothetical protein